jgi:hypothetical protein
MPEILWSDEDNLRTLREATFIYLYRTATHEGGAPLSDLARRVSSGAGTGTIDQNTYQALRRFMFAETRGVRQGRLLEGLFQIVIRWFYENRNKGDVGRSHIVYSLQRRGWFSPFEASSRAKPDQSALPQVAEFAFSAVEMFSIFFGTSERDFEQAAKFLTGRARCAGLSPSDADRQGFVTYRYSAIPGRVVKTFTVVTPPSERMPYCTFRNFYQHQDIGLSKESIGVVVRLERGLYMLGRINDGEAIKLVVLPNAVQKSRFLNGLVVTTSDSGAPLVSRIVLERTEKKHSDEIGPEVMPFERAMKVLDPRILRWLRNYTEFEMDKTIVSTDDNEPISVHRLVELVGRYCSGKFELNREPFNPADHRHYPFNQALLTYDPRER